MTQKQIAELLGVDQSYISRLYNGYLLPGKKLRKAWESITGWQPERWDNVSVAQIQKLLDSIGG